VEKNESMSSCKTKANDKNASQHPNIVVHFKCETINRQGCPFIPPMLAERPFVTPVVEGVCSFNLPLLRYGEHRENVNDDL
jgi:hypothetical protein